MSEIVLLIDYGIVFVTSGTLESLLAVAIYSNLLPGNLIDDIEYRDIVSEPNEQLV